MHFIKFIFVVLISVVAILFYLQAIDGPYVRDLKLNPICPPGQHEYFYSYKYNYKCSRNSLMSAFNEKIENVLGISRLKLNDFEEILFLLFLPLLAVARNLYDYRTASDKKASINFWRLYFRSALVIIIAGSIGLLPSIYFGLPTCIGEYCMPTYNKIFWLSIITLLFTLISCMVTRYLLNRAVEHSDSI